MGISLTKLKAEVKDEDHVLVTIITDGYENASKEYSGKAIMQLVDELKTKGWIFAYIGANQDVEKVAVSMGIRNSLCFEAHEEDARRMFRKERESRDALYCCIDEGIDAKQLSEREYFGNTNKVKTEDTLVEKKEEKKKKKWWRF